MAFCERINHPLTYAEYILKYIHTSSGPEHSLSRRRLFNDTTQCMIVVQLCRKWKEFPKADSRSEHPPYLGLVLSLVCGADCRIAYNVRSDGPVSTASPYSSNAAQVQLHLGDEGM